MLACRSKDLPSVPIFPFPGSLDIESAPVQILEKGFLHWRPLPDVDDAMFLGLDFCRGFARGVP